jgi:hypothetical protein
MGKILIFSLFIGVLFTVSGCGRAHPSPGAQGKTPATAAAPTNQAAVGPSQATLVPSPTPEGTASYRLMNSCDLLNSRDVASLFSSAEVEGPRHRVSQVNHLVFSKATISATESSCVYYVFHEPGSKDMELLQVTYWVDIPDQAAPSAWAQVWVDARAKAAQAVSGIGDGAFYHDGRLTFKKGSLYVTIEIVDTNLNTDTSAGANQQIEMEKRIALDTLSRLG